MGENTDQRIPATTVAPRSPKDWTEPNDSESVAAQAFWEELGGDGGLGGHCEADAQTAEQEPDQQDWPPVLLPGEPPP